MKGRRVKMFMLISIVVLVAVCLVEAAALQHYEALIISKEAKYEAVKRMYFAESHMVERLQKELLRRSEVIAELERLNGVKVSSVTYYAPTGHRTASGTVPEPGRTVAVDKDVIPLGSDVYIEGIGWRVAEDTGGAINGTDIDVFVGSKQEASRGGRDNLRILWRAPNGQ